MWNSAYDLANQKHNLQLCVYCDADDWVTHNKLAEMALKFRIHQVLYFVGAYRCSQSDMTNKAATLARGDLLHFAGDDVLWRTEGWDDIVRAEFAKYPDGILYAYPHDGYQPETFGTHGCLHRQLVELLGYMAPPETRFIDTWYNEILDRLGRKVHLPIFAEHMHPSAGKADSDATYAAHLNREQQLILCQQYPTFAQRREDDYQKLRKHIESYEAN